MTRLIANPRENYKKALRLRTFAETMDVSESLARQWMREKRIETFVWGNSSWSWRARLTASLRSMAALWLRHRGIDDRHNPPTANY
jgi:hypothetical protein